MIIGIYRPPNAAKRWFDVFDLLLQDVSLLGPIVLLGDLNANLMLPHTYPANTLLNSLAQVNLEVCEVFPTRITSHSATCLDIIAIDKSLDCVEYSLDDCAASDHFPIAAAIQVLSTTQPNLLLREITRI